MLSTDSRAVASDLLRAPAGYTLDVALLTTYTLDLEVALTLPFNVITQSESAAEDVVDDPLQLVEPLRQAAQRFHIFVDQAGIAVPKGQRELYSMLEPSLHPVKAPGGGILHAKVWLARFITKGAAPRLRVAIMSRNLTFDRSWDVAISSEGKPADKQPSKSGRALATFFLALPEHSVETVSIELETKIETIADELSRTRFPAPPGFDSPIDFHVLGLANRGKLWRPALQGSRTLAIAPFVSHQGLKAIERTSWDRRILVGRQEELDQLSADSLAPWQSVYTLDDNALGESEDDSTSRHFGLHAKIIAVEKNHHVTWYVGSANLTRAAFDGSSIEVMASIRGPKGWPSGKSGNGIDRFWEAGFGQMLRKYQAGEKQVPPNGNEDLLRSALKDLLDAKLKLACSPAGSDWTLEIIGASSIKLGRVRVSTWPVSISQAQAQALTDAPKWTLPIQRLTSLIAFRLTLPGEDADEVCVTLKLPAENLPEDRLHHVLLSLISDRRRFFALLRALLGGVEGSALLSSAGHGDTRAGWSIGLDEDALLESLLRIAAHHPERLQPLGRLIADVRKTEGGKEIVPDDFLELWQAVTQVADVKSAIRAAT